MEFSKSGCVVHDQQSGKIIVRGPKVGRLFPFLYHRLHIFHYLLSPVTLFMLITKHGISI